MSLENNTDEASNLLKKFSLGGNQANANAPRKHRYAGIIIAPISEKQEKLCHSDIDTTKNISEHEGMNTPSREEFSAKLEAIESRMDSRIASAIGKIDEAMARSEEREINANSRFERIEKTFDKLESSLELDKQERKRDFSSLKTTIIVTAIATVIGLYSANTTTLQTMLAAFESGKNLSQSQAELKQQSEQIKKQSDEIQEAIQKQSEATKVLLERLNQSKQTAPK